VIDAMPLARRADDVVLVVRLGSSKLAQLARLGDLLDQNGIRPAGFVVVGGAAPKEQDYLAAQRRRGVEADWLVASESEPPTFPSDG
jgi:Mrp family chromosome partitioning ATPase